MDKHIGLRDIVGTGLKHFDELNRSRVTRQGLTTNRRFIAYTHTHTNWKWNVYRKWSPKRSPFKILTFLYTQQDGRFSDTSLIKKYACLSKHWLRITEIQQWKLHGKGVGSDERKEGRKEGRKKERKKRERGRNILANSVIHDRPDSLTPRTSHREGTGSILGHSM
jgi:hypothetical protein